MTAWQEAGLIAAPAVEHHHAYGIRITPAGRRTPQWVLSCEQARTLAWWLLDTVGDRNGPADPDRVRAVLGEQRADLAARSANAVCEDFGAGLAWAARAEQVPCRLCAAEPGEPCRNLRTGEPLAQLPAHNLRITDAGITHEPLDASDLAATHERTPRR